MTSYTKTGNTQFDQEILYFARQYQLNAQKAEATGNYNTLYRYIDSLYTYIGNHHVDANGNFTFDNVTNTATSEQKAFAIDSFVNDILLTIVNTEALLKEGGVKDVASLVNNVNTYLSKYNDLIDDSAHFEVGQTARINVFANDVNLTPLQLSSLKLIDPTTHQPATNNTIVVKGEGAWTVDTAHPGEVVFTPEAGFTKSPTPVEYIIDNQVGGKTLAPATISLTYDQSTTPTMNHNPVAKDDLYTAISGQYSPAYRTILNPLVNDTDADGDNLTVTHINGQYIIPGQHNYINVDKGQIVVSNTGEVSFYSNGNATGKTSFNYTVSDSKGGTATGVETVDITHINQAPTAYYESKSTTVGGKVSGNFINYIKDPENDPVTITGIESIQSNNSSEVVYTGMIGQSLEGAYGHLTLNANGSYTYVADKPSNLGAGGSGYDLFEYTVSDSHGASSTNKISISVTGGVNDAPTAIADHYIVNQGDQIGINPAANDTDIDSNHSALYVTSIANQAVVRNYDTTVAVDHGSVHIAKDGQMTLTVDSNYLGPINIPYTISDGSLTSNAGTINVDVMANAANNHAPIAQNDTFTISSESAKTINPLANDTDVDGDPLTITQINGVAVSVGSQQAIPVDKGTVNISDKGEISFESSSYFGFEGPASFNYTVSDGKGGFSTATMNIADFNHDPYVFGFIDAATIENGTSSGNILSKFDDNDHDTLSVTGIQYQAHDGSITTGTIGQVMTTDYGHFTINADGTYTFDADKSDKSNENLNGDYNPYEGFRVTVSDDRGGSIEAPFTIDILARNDAPIAVADHYAVNQGGTVVLTPIANDTDVDNSNLYLRSIGGEYTLVYGGASEKTIAVDHGSIHIGTDGMITFTADANYQGSITIPYTVTDYMQFDEGTADSTITIEVSNSSTTTQANAVDYAIYHDVSNNALLVNTDTTPVI